MNGKRYKDDEKGLAIELNHDDNIALIYNYSNGEINEDSEGILKELNSDTYKKASTFFDKELKEFGVTITDETQSVI